MKIRKAVWEDLPRMEEIYAHAREQMKLNGNPTQWGDDRPPKAAVEESVRNGYAYVAEAEDGHVCGTFSFLIGEDPTYRVIREGQWLREAPYGTIHRVASDNTEKGLLGAALEFASKYGVDIRMDTHRDNKIMLHNLEKHGFLRCGLITVDDGTERIAFQRMAEEIHGET